MTEKTYSSQAEKTLSFVLFALASLGLYASSLYSYLLFHTLVEIFSVLVIFSVFILTWNSRRLLDNHYFLFLGISFLSSGALELVHTFAYKGFGVFPGYDANLPTQLWIAFRYVFSLSFLIAPFFITRKIDVWKTLIAFAVVTVLLFSAIFSGNFPDCFIEGRGLTPFKVYSEYAIIAILIAAIGLLIRERTFFNPRVLSPLILSMVSALAAEAAFTQYISVYGSANFLGHLLLFLSAFFVYRGIVVIGMKEPASVLFRELELSNEALRESKERYAAIQGQAPFAIGLLRPPEGVIVEVNAAWEKMFGYSRQEALGKTAMELGIVSDPDVRAAMYQEIRARGFVRDWEMAYRTRSGEDRLGRFNFDLIEISGQKFYLGTAVDVTEMKRAEGELREKTLEYVAMFERSVIGKAQADPVTGRFLRVNQAFAEMTGYSAEELCRMTFLEITHPEDRDCDAPGFEPVQAGLADKWHIEKRYVRKDGGIIWVNVSGNIIRSDDGRPARTIAVIQDITRRRQAEEEVKESRRKYQALIETTGDFIWEVDSLGRYTYCSPQMEKLWGLKPEEMIGKTPFDMMPAEDKKSATGFFAGLVQSPRQFTAFESAAYDGQGRLTYLETSGVPFYGDDGLLLGFRGISRDITARKRAEQALLESEERLRLAYQAAKIGAFDWNVQTNVNVWTPELEAMYGLAPGEFGRTQTAWEQLVASEDRAAALGWVDQSFATGEPVEGEWRVIWRDGSVHWIAGRFQVFKDAVGRPLRLTGVNIDITDRKRGEEALRQSEARFKLSMEATNDGLWDWDIQTDEAYFSPAYFQMLGYEPNEFPGRGESWKSLIHPDDFGRTWEANLACIEGRRESFEVEFRMKARDGQWHWILCRGKCVARDSQGRALRLVGTHVDLTERKQVEETLRASRLAALNLMEDALDARRQVEKAAAALRESEEKFRRAFADAAIGFAMTTPDGRFVDANPAYCRLTGYGVEELQAVEFPRLIHPDDHRANMRQIERMLAGEISDFVVENRYIRKDKSVVWVRKSVSLVRDRAKAPQWIIALVEDISERKEVEEALRQSREDLDRAQEVGQIGWWRLDTWRNVLTWSDENHRIFGVPKGTPLTYESFLGIVHPDDRQYVDRELKASLRGEPYDIEHRIVVGQQVKWVREKAYLEFDAGGKLLGGFGITQDITERKQAEEALRKSEARLRKAQEALQKINEELEQRIQQRTVELIQVNSELVKKSSDLNERVKELNCLYVVSSLLSEQEVSLEAVLQRVVDALSSGWQYADATCARIIVNGHEFRTDNYQETPFKLSRPIKAQGKPVGILEISYLDDNRASGGGPFLKEEEALISTIADLLSEFLERRQNAEMLKRSEARFRRLSREFNTLLDAIPESLILLDRDLKILWGNSGAAVAVKKTLSALVWQHCYRLIYRRTEPCEGCPAVKCITTGVPESKRLQTPGWRIWEMEAFPLIDETGKVQSVLTVTREITEKLKLEEEAVRSAKLASLGELAAGVAHEINNPVNSIINYAQILLNKGDRARKEYAFAGEIVREGGRIASIVKSLLTFVRDTSELMGPVSVENLLTSSLVLTNPQMRKDRIAVTIGIAPDLPEVTGNAQQLQQVFLNVINNARYALNKKYEGSDQNKVFSILCERTTVDGIPFVCVTFEDRGTGIPAALIPRVTDPFFTTKPGAEGTGLGLSISSNIVRDHGGRLTITSVEGEYTRVVIELPAADTILMRSAP